MESDHDLSIDSLGGSHNTAGIRSFVHKPLDHTKTSIRLLRVHDSLSEDGLIRCSMIHATTEETPYNCLSYRWGTSDPPQKILIDGGRLLVGPNLFQFLEAFRESPSNRRQPYLWIDAICIAQENTEERNHQVAQMGSIYSSAQVVYIWLGENAALASILPKIQNWKRPIYADLELFRSICFSNFIYNNEYWTRAWITQEITLAREIVVLLGNEAIDLGHLQSILDSCCLTDSESYEEHNYFQVGHARRELSHQNHKPTESLISLLVRFRKKNCFLAQDRIFSLLSLCDPSCKVPVDYNQDPAQLVWSVLANNKGRTCICEALCVVQSLRLNDASSSAYRGSQSWKDYYIDIDMVGLQLTERASSQPMFRQIKFILGAQRQHICEAVENAISSAVERILYRISPGDSQYPPLPRKDIPFFYRKLDIMAASKLAQTRAEEMSIIEAEPGSQKYTLRFAMQFIVDTCVDTHEDGQMCPIRNRYLSWRYPAPVPDKPSSAHRILKMTSPTFREAWDLWNSGECKNWTTSQWADSLGGELTCILHTNECYFGDGKQCVCEGNGREPWGVTPCDLSQHMSFEQCVLSYGWFLNKPRDIVQTLPWVDYESWNRGRPWERISFWKFLIGVTRYICGASTQHYAADLGEAIAVSKRGGIDHSWGPCHFVHLASD